MALVYVTGHRNPDTDSISAAIGYAELKRRLDPRNTYIAARLGDPNAQTEWVLDRAGVEAPGLLEHILLRVEDVMEQEFPTATTDEDVRDVGLAMAREDRGYLTIVDDEGRVAGMMTERVLVRKDIW